MTFVLTPQRSNRMPVLEWWRSVDHALVGLFIVLILSGLILSLAASPPASARLGYSDAFFFFKRHMFFAVTGVCGALTLSLFSPQNARRLAILALLGAFLIMLALPIIGYEVKGAQRWVRIGSFGLQPSEFVKPAFIVFAAWMFAHRARDNSFPGIAIVFGVYLVLVLMLLRQPDFGQSFLLTVCFGAVFFFAGLSMGWIIFFMGVSVCGSIAAYLALPHVQSRIQRFLNPEGSDTYQTDKALEAIGQGGWFGRGPGEGRVKEQLPDAHTDFIFAVAVEEFGFILSLLLVGLLGALVVQTYRKALRLNDHFAQLAVAGLATMIGVQTIINLAVNLNIAPPKGMTLPFISYGGSSILALSFAMGLILAFTRQRPGAYGYRDR